MGDVLVAINGHKPITTKDWNIVYERFIERLNNVGSDILLTIKRDGQEQNVTVKKSFVTLVPKQASSLRLPRSGADDFTGT